MRSVATGEHAPVEQQSLARLPAGDFLAGQRVETDLQIARHQPLHGIAVKTDELAQERNGQHGLAVLIFKFENDLGEDAVGKIIAGFGIFNLKLFAALDHLGEVFQCDVG